MGLALLATPACSQTTQAHQSRVAHVTLPDQMYECVHVWLLEKIMIDFVCHVRALLKEKILVGCLLV